MASPSGTRSGPWRPSRAGALVAAAALSAVACVAAPDDAGPLASTPEPTRSGSPRAPGAIASSRPPRAPGGVLEALVTDASGRRRAEIPVRVTGEGVRITRVTDARGVVRERLAPGTYDVRIVPGCTGRMMVSFAGRGTVGVTDGAFVQAPLRVEAVRRIAAGPPLLRDREPPWPRRIDVTLRFRIWDRCTDQPRPSHRFDDLRYRPSGHLRVVDGTPRRSDADAYATVVVRCVRPGPASLVLGDPANPNDGVDVLTFTPPLDPTATWCG